MLNNCNLQSVLRPGAKILFAGVGGVSMSALCLYCQKKGMLVSGYDAAENDLSRAVEAHGVSVSYVFDPAIFEGLDAVVYTAAIREDDPVLKYPREKKIPLISRSDALGFLSLDKKQRIGVAGTHGKSTVTGMLTKIFLAADRDPMVLAGATLKELDGTLRIGSGDELIFEACEYQDAFLHFAPTVSVILDVERDHVDYFKDDESLVRSFSRYAQLPGKEGVCILNYDTPLARRVSESVEQTPVISVKNEGEADYTAQNVQNRHGRFSFTACYRGKKLFDVSLGVPGAFQVGNALCAIAASRYCGVPDEKIVEGLKEFHGVDRRFQYRGALNGIDVYDDYAHHPSEIAATLSAARDCGYQKIVCVFQSHTYSRTQAFWEEFKEVFAPCKEVIFADIYPAREEPIEGIEAKLLARETKNARYCGDFQAIADYLDTVRDADLFLIMGAGSVIALTDLLLQGGDA